jgi:hypothetical protein
MKMTTHLQLRLRLRVVEVDLHSPVRIDEMNAGSQKKDDGAEVSAIAFQFLGFTSGNLNKIRGCGFRLRSRESTSEWL